ncbi:MAG: RnfABCDGE type electron transport complex subunit B [Tissierellia bacterium]|nr:RnfABCDGE type electron transport complex subunit B [Tissierellia bacterium]
MNPIIIAVAVVGIMGLLFGALLSVAANIFHVEVDEKVVLVRAELPGANCGACGFPGCDGLATAIALKDGPVNGCPVGGQPVAEKIATIMGKAAGDSVKQVACVMCNGTPDNAKEKHAFSGMSDCRSNAAFQGGSKACSYGCLGGGTCVSVCPFDAIHIVNGVAVVDKDKCTACQKCISVCPRNVISLVPYDQEVVVKCNSTDDGKTVRANCSVGCIGCGLCVRNSEEGAFVVENKLAHAVEGKDYGEAVNKCPTKAIHYTSDKPVVEAKVEEDQAV